MDTNEIIFNASGKSISYIDLKNALTSVGISEGDTLFLQTQLLAFGTLSKKMIKEKDLCFNLIINSFKEVIGSEGNLMMTTFSNAPLKTGVFDTENTPSEGGILTEFFRKQNGVKRSNHPTHSFAILGKDNKFWLDIDDSTFGPDSIYGKLYKKNATLVFWGASFYYCTFNHFIEEMAKVSYRKKHKATIETLSNGKKEKKEIIYYTKSDRFRIDFSRFEELLLQRKVLKKISLGNGYILAIKSQDLFNEGIKALQKEKYFFLKVQPLFSYWLQTIKKIIKSI